MKDLLLANEWSPGVIGDSVSKPMALPINHPAHKFAESVYVLACRSLPTSHTPVWFQRQAGRSLPEYRNIRGDGSILEAIHNPELAAEITLQPVNRYGVDAAILFSDIVVPVDAVGFKIDVVPGIGPVAASPFRERSDLKRIRELDPEKDTSYVIETVKILARELAIPLIGFAGAPFTIASYLIEGRPSRDHAKTKSLMHSDPKLWHELMERLADISIISMRSQVLAGASAVQLFDSWAGALTPSDYRNYVLPHSQRVFAELADLEVPRAHFGVTTGELLDQFGEAGPEVVGVDWRVSIEQARLRVGENIAIQGNLDPALCLAPWEVVKNQTLQILKSAGNKPGHIFNLGHGVLPETNPEILEKVVELVHRETSSGSIPRS